MLCIISGNVYLETLPSVKYIWIHLIKLTKTSKNNFIVWQPIIWPFMRAHSAQHIPVSLSFIKENLLLQKTSTSSYLLLSQSCMHKMSSKVFKWGHATTQICITGSQRPLICFIPSALLFLSLIWSSNEVLERSNWRRDKIDIKRNNKMQKR